MSSDSIHVRPISFTQSVTAAAPAAQAQAKPTQVASAAGSDATATSNGTTAPQGKDHSHYGFHDFLDTINPLQHLPVISTIYRHLTGDTMDSNAARVVGDTIYGGPIGLVAGLVSAHMVNENGKDMGDRVLAMVQGDSDAPGAAAQNTAQLADATPQASGQSASQTSIGMPAVSVGGVGPGQIGIVNQGGIKSAGTNALSALPAKKPPNLMPHLPPVGAYLPGQPEAKALAAQSAARSTAQQNAGTDPAQVASNPPALPNQIFPTPGQNQGQNGMPDMASLAALSVPGSSTSQSSFMPSMGSPHTAAALAAAAPVTPQTVQLQGMAPPTTNAAASQAPAPIAQRTAMLGAQRGIAIDTSMQGIAAMRANSHVHAPVELQLPAGVLPSVASSGSSAPAASAPSAQQLAGNDFVARMKQGLEKYQAMMKQQNGMATGPTGAAPAAADAATLAASTGVQPAGMTAPAKPSNPALARP